MRHVSHHLLCIFLGMILFTLSGPAPTLAAIVDNGDGTFADLSSGTMWLKDTQCLGKRPWDETFTTVADFNTANSTNYGCQGYTASYADWSMPSATQLGSIAFGPGDDAFILLGSSSGYELWANDVIPPQPSGDALIQPIRDFGGGNYHQDNQQIVQKTDLHFFVPVRIYTDFCPQDPDKIRPGICGCGLPDQDSDNDSVVDCLDRCPGFDDSLDADRDLMPDLCDTFPNDGREWADSDGDGIGDNADICPAGADSLQSDSDGVADPCDVFPTDSLEWLDSDGDGIGDNEDNCPLIANFAQNDVDADALGDLCDIRPSLPNYGSVVDAPHNAARGIFCQTCHSYSLWWQFSPVSGQADTNTKKDATCLACHGTGAGAIQTHGAAALGPMHRSSLNAWSVACSDCHNPHEQEQLELRGSASTDLYLITGTFGDNTTFATQRGKTSFSYTLKDTNNPAWGAPATWSKKDTIGAPSGLILVEDTANATNTHEILSANSTTITIKGGIDKAQAAGTSFGLIYGRLIRSEMPTPSALRAVNYFTPTLDSYADLTVPPKGLCQVCHESTLYWTNDGLNTGHYTGTNCTNCHKARLGFKSYEVDTTAPIISLVGSASMNTECGISFSDPGTTITDNSSINLTVSATSIDQLTTGLQTITYSGADNSGNQAQPIIRDVTVVDTTSPTLSLVGSSSMIIPVGGPYTELGAQVTDSCSATGAVQIGGNVDVHTPGDYLLTYNISDDAGNPASEIHRTVAVGRWLDNQDGTITDKASGLIWLQDGNCTNFGAPVNWDNATTTVSLLADGSCGLSDGSLPGDWRLPSRSELKNFTNGVEAVRSSAPFDFTHLQAGNYWTSTETILDPSFAWYVSLQDGLDNWNFKTLTYSVLAVRSGP